MLVWHIYIIYMCVCVCMCAQHTHVCIYVCVCMCNMCLRKKKKSISELLPSWKKSWSIRTLNMESPFFPTSMDIFQKKILRAEFLNMAQAGLTDSSACSSTSFFTTGKDKIWNLLWAKTYGSKDICKSPKFDSYRYRVLSL